MPPRGSPACTSTNFLLAASPYAQSSSQPAPWDLATLDAIVSETLDLACLRAVDVDALDAIGHFLPALYFAINLKGDTVSTDFHPLATPGA